ncbi:transcriptional regulator, TetR family [Pseudomonas flavescens]|uniref:Transcriptional regulator, TetR family n=1 Tax=Phytopseudomonas flavescens TaxID=29435 RepID=A0A1G8NJG4_9GAMM|nr:TetR family transcriptional regulator [Pseudomonas flavescens]SDI80389.1 transcriptional regulator, TetR family [Pseudomonas flavescens]
MRRTKEQAEQTRASILKSAEILFLEKGVAHTSLEHVAKHAGVTRGAVYWHFQNKAHLFHDMLSQVRLPPEQLAGRLQESHSGDSLQSLRELCVEGIASIAVDEQKRRIFTVLLHRCEFTEELREAEERHEAFINQFIDLCEAIFAQPSVRTRLRAGMTARLAACTLHAMMVGMLSDWLRDNSLFDPHQDGPVMIDGLFHGLIHNWS